MGANKKAAAGLKIANTMHLGGILVALFGMSGPRVSPSLVIKKTSRISEAGRLWANKITDACGKILKQKTHLLIDRRALFML